MTVSRTLTSVSLTPVEQQVFEAQNQERISRGVPALELDARLVGVARQRAKQTSEEQSLAHFDASGDKVFGPLLKRAGYSFQLVGENLARNSFDDDDAGAEAVAGFLISPPHRENLLDPRFRRAGVGALKGPEGATYIAVIYADR